MCGGFEAGGDWSVGYPAFDGLKCYAVVSGRCWLAVDGVAEPVRLEAGDCFLLPLARGYRLASDLALPAVDFISLVGGPLRGRIATYNGGGECFGVGGVFTFAPEHADVLLGLLPPVVHVRNEADRVDLRWSLERMMHELRVARPGGELVAQHLASMLLVQTLRAYLAERPRGGVGWLFALADPQMRAAIDVMHDDPARRWTIADVADRIGMSRSSFAAKFKATVGVSPIEYLTRWRMLLAGDRLSHSNASVSEISAALGYESESAFSAAFKRTMKCSPRQYARRCERISG